MRPWPLNNKDKASQFPRLASLAIGHDVAQ